MSLKQMPHPLTIHPDLIAADELIYKPNGLIATPFRSETESKEYGAYDFDLNDRRIKFRVAKITPTKIGQFVTLWKRIGKGPIQPFDARDPIDLYVVSVRNSDYFGQFVFPKAVLLEMGILSQNGQGGKRAMRVYPPWDIADNRQAKNTQKWQLLYFYEILATSDLELGRIQSLFELDIERTKDCYNGRESKLLVREK